MDGSYYSAEGIAYEAHEEVLPGVKWGRSSWIASPAFWYALAQNARDEDNYVAPEGTSLKEVVAFCMLGGYGIKAEINYAAYNRLDAAGVLCAGAKPDEQQLRDLLSEPLKVGDRHIKYRFPNQKASRLATVFQELEQADIEVLGASLLRNWLMTLKGIGPKTASWIVRNWLGSDEVAIIDVHLMRVGQFMGLFPTQSSLPKDYEFLEGRFLDFADRIGVRASLLDALIWREGRNIPPKYLCAAH